MMMIYSTDDALLQMLKLLVDMQIYMFECCLLAPGRCSLLLSAFYIADTKVKPSTTVPPELCLTMWSLCLMVQEQSGTPT